MTAAGEVSSTETMKSYHNPGDNSSMPAMPQAAVQSVGTKPDRVPRDQRSLTNKDLEQLERRK